MKQSNHADKKHNEETFIISCLQEQCSNIHQTILIRRTTTQVKQHPSNYAYKNNEVTFIKINSFMKPRNIYHSWYTFSLMQEEQQSLSKTIST